MLKRISVDDYCDDLRSCQSVWEDDEIMDDLVIIGHRVPAGTVPLAEGEIAIRIRRRVVANARIR
jgi:hypothetical protein